MDAQAYSCFGCPEHFSAFDYPLAHCPQCGRWVLDETCELEVIASPEPLIIIALVMGDEVIPLVATE